MAPEILVYQTSDPIRYFEMLSYTSRTTRTFCIRHGLSFEMFVGYRRGYFPWQAERNRILAIADRLRSGFKGWFIYLDADAFVHDLSFDLLGYLASRVDSGMVIAHGASRRPHDVNNGVFFLNLGHPVGQELARLWVEREAATSEEALRQGEQWHSVLSSQSMLQIILREAPRLCESIHYEERSFINAPNASFIRQILRADEANFETRLQLIRQQTSMILGQNGLLAAGSPGSVDRSPSQTAEPEQLYVDFATTFRSNFTSGIQLSKYQAQAVGMCIRLRAPGCNLLVFGLGNDTELWSRLNADGRTLFVETDPSWIEKIRARHEHLEVLEMDTHGLTVSKSLDLTSNDLDSYPVPEGISRFRWDVILVDAPPGFKPELPGRALSIYWSHKLAHSGTHVFVDDYERPLESRFCDLYFRHRRKTTSCIVPASAAQPGRLLFWSMADIPR